MPSKQFLAYLLGATMVAGSLYGASAALGGPSTIQVQQSEAAEPLTTPVSLVEADPAPLQATATDPTVAAGPEAPAYPDYEEDEYEEEEYEDEDHDEHPEDEHGEHEEDDDHGPY